MKLPRDISGEDFASKLQKFGYIPTRQTGSHLRLTTIQNGKHNVTIPKHEHLRVGTLSGILGDIAHHFGISRDKVMEVLF